jgi:tetrahydromethanopterin S-methyltransferase subunit G
LSEVGAYVDVAIMYAMVISLSLLALMILLSRLVPH